MSVRMRFLPRHLAFRPPQGRAGEVADFSFHDGPIGSVGLLPDRILFAGFGVL
jgi:hypothetical protein